MARYTKNQVAEARARCLALFPRGSTVYCVLRRVAASGMTRYIDVFAIVDNKPAYASGWVAIVLGRNRDKEGAIVEKGAGMDMLFNLTYSLSCALYCPETLVKLRGVGVQRQGYDKEAAYSLKYERL